MNIINKPDIVKCFNILLQSYYELDKTEMDYLYDKTLFSNKKRKDETLFYIKQVTRKDIRDIIDNINDGVLPVGLTHDDKIIDNTIELYNRNNNIIERLNLVMGF